MKLIEKNRGLRINIRDTSLSKNEQSANKFLEEGKTIGCFYIESQAMRGMLRRLTAGVPLMAISYLWLRY